MILCKGWKIYFGGLAIVFIACFLCPSQALAADTTVTCTVDGCSADQPLLPDTLHWSPGSTVSRTVVVQNQSGSEIKLSAQAKITMESELNKLLTVSWRNGAHRLIWQGELSQVHAIPLATIPKNSARTFILGLSLPAGLGNAVQGKSAQASLELQIEATSHTSTLSSTATKPKGKSVPTKPSSAGQVLGQTVHFILPDLHAVDQSLLEASPSQVRQIVQAARKQIWWAWLLLVLEMVALQPWNSRKSSWQVAAAGSLGAIATWLASGSTYMTGLAVLLAVGWFCWRYIPKQTAVVESA